MNECNDFGEEAALLALSKMKCFRGSWSCLLLQSHQERSEDHYLLEVKEQGRNRLLWH